MSKGMLYPGLGDATAYFEYTGDAEFDFDEPVVVQVSLTGLTIYQVNDPERAEAAANIAEAHAASALASKNAAQSAATTATNKASEAQNSATAAASSAADAAASASQASGHKDAAASSASAAASSATSANNAKTASETARDKARKWAEENENVAVESGKYSAKHHALKAAASASAASSSKDAAQSAATTATTKASEAQSSASAAATSASNALNSENAAKGHADDAKDYRDGAIAAKNQAVTAKNDAEAALDEFNGRYLGAYAAAPAGTLAGQLYFNTTTNLMMVYDGVSWVPVASGGDMLASVFDPNGVAADAFDMDNMVEGTNNLIFKPLERKKLSRVAYNPAVIPQLDLVFTDPAAFLPEWFSRASGGTYFGPDGTIKVAAANEPRIEYDPATGELLGLLVEEQRTNLVRYSQMFEIEAWSKNRVSVTPASIPSPTGVAYHVTDTTENNTHILGQTLLSQVGDTAYCRWVIAKSDGSGKRLRLYTPTFANWVAPGNVIFNLETGTIISATLPDGESSGYGMTPLGDGWHLCWIWSRTIAEPPGSHLLYIQLEAADGAVTYEGDGLTGFYLAAAQVEIGKYPTSYIPTDGAAVTRAPDFLTIPLNAINFKRWAGTVFADFRSYRPPSAFSDVNDRAAIWSISDKDSASGDNSLDLIYSTQLFLLSRIDNNASYVSSNIGAQPEVPAYEKVAVAFRGSEAKVSRNGGSVTNQTVGFRLEPLTLLRVGNDSVNRVGYRVLKGHMRRITYYPAFLPDDDLQSLTM